MTKKPVIECCATVWTGWSHKKCLCAGKFVDTDGKHYCGTHYPPNVQARRDKINAKYEAQAQAWHANQAIQAKARAETARKVDGFDKMLAVLQRLSAAAMARDNTMGDQCALFAAQAELRDANKLAMEVMREALGLPVVERKKADDTEGGAA